MNQPSSRCHGWVDQLVQIGELVEPIVVPKKRRAVMEPQRSAAYEDWNPPSPMDLHHPEDPMDVDSAGQQCVVEEFPGAATTYEQERTSFLRRFDQDQFSEERRTNLYYPFASRVDWELGLWLTRSGLSMAATDSLLSLELVSSMTSCPDISKNA